MQFSLPRAFARTLIIFGALPALPGLAFAGAGLLTTVVTPLSPSVTYSILATTTPARPALDTYIGYTVSVANVEGNTINNISFTGKTVVTDPDEQAVFSSAEGITCTTAAGGTEISCAIGQLKAGEAFPTFAVFFKAPVKDAASPLPDGTPDQVTFSGITYYAETTGGPTSPPDNSVAEWTTGAVTLGTFNPTLVKSAVQKGGGNLYTGSGGVTSPADPFATTVDVPAGTTFTTAEILESPDAVNCTNNFSACFRSDITIPGTFSPYLSIVLRQDASTILKGTKIDSVLIQYTGTDGTVIVGDCASPTTPRTDGLPCIAKRTYYRNKTVPGWTADLDGDFEWTLINLWNGSYKVF
ncbi:hypothetical protein [uncultured Piscinibacter sp.]|uniref:hypothetical protein n=1 Tax=uncultured Piscinibacter sp. TaxID=1131835 RepID=UPI0026076DA0|nr:hypothetical protein [uncultured Piscinibacter sp.]